VTASTPANSTDTSRACGVTEYHSAGLIACTLPSGHVGLHVFPSSKSSPAQMGYSLVHGDRRQAYGDPKESLERVAKLWEPILGCSVSITQVALCLVQLKIARELHASSFDNLADIAGYAELLSIALGETDL